MFNEKLERWKKTVASDETAYSNEILKMDKRDALYKGDRNITKLIENQKVKVTYHLRNIIAELIESQVDSNIPVPKVTARRPGDESKAKLIEDFLRYELDRMPFEELNDLEERIMRIQGGAPYLCEWDSTQRTHTTVGELNISSLHPRQVIPQDGVTSSIEKMDRITLKLAQTKGYIKRRYDKDVTEEGESDPDVRGSAVSSSSDIVTQYVVYYRNNKGGIGIYSWVNDIELEDIEDYQARRLDKCTACGKTKPYNTDVCECGSTTFIPEPTEYVEVYEPIIRTGEVNPIAAPYTETVAVTTEDGTVLTDESGLPIETTRIVPAKIPVYKPDVYPVILIKNVSQADTFLGGSDVDLITDQQNTINRLEQKIIDKLIKSGSYLSLPDTASVTQDEEEMTVIRLGSIADKEMLGVYNLEADISADISYMLQVYEEARQTIGVTDSYQGRPDRTATSGKAKEISAQQSAGRFASKKTMKAAGFAKLFEIMFKFALAYSDEPQAVMSKDMKGNAQYTVFSKWDFLEVDSTGTYWWNDQFIFSCDPTTALASDREAMWQETRMNLSSGTFGNPQEYATLILFWSKMEELHYPGAGDTKKWLEERAAEAELKQQAMLEQQIIAQIQQPTTK
jgi:hypothetical protein